jgi:hypothetical protein
MIIIHSERCIRSSLMRIEGSRKDNEVKGYVEGRLTCGTVQRKDDNVSQRESMAAMTGITE